MLTSGLAESLAVFAAVRSHLRDDFAPNDREVCNNAVEVLQAKPKMLASVLVRRGSALGKIGQYSRALDDLNKAIELQPSFAASLENDLKALHKLL